MAGWCISGMTRQQSPGMLERRERCQLWTDVTIVFCPILFLLSHFLEMICRTNTINCHTGLSVLLVITNTNPTMWHNRLVLPARKGFINTPPPPGPGPPPLVITVKMSGLSHQTICINTGNNYVTICLTYHLPGDCLSL